MEVEELTVAFSDEDTGEEVIKELDKEILSKGAWPTVMFLYQEKDAKTGMSCGRQTYARHPRPSGHRPGNDGRHQPTRGTRP